MKITRRIIGSLLVAASSFVLTAAHALDLSAISNKDAAAGLKEALNKGSAAAVAKLGVQNGFLSNPKVKIPLPDGLRRAEKAMKLLGRQQQFDELVVSINRAAEAAVPEAKVLLLDAVKSMSVQDAKGIISGGDDSVTKFFQSKTQDKLAQRFLPIVKGATDKVGLAQQYNSLAGQAASFGVVKQQDARIENYVTRKAMDGLFLMIAEEERAIRKDPVRAGSELLRRVFGG